MRGHPGYKIAAPNTAAIRLLSPALGRLRNVSETIEHGRVPNTRMSSSLTLPRWAAAGQQVQSITSCADQPSNGDHRASLYCRAWSFAVHRRVGVKHLTWRGGCSHGEDLPSSDASRL